MRIRAHQHRTTRTDLPQARPGAFDILIFGTRSDHHHVDAHTCFPGCRGGGAAPRDATAKQRECARTHQVVGANAFAIAFQHRVRQTALSVVSNNVVIFPSELKSLPFDTRW